MEFGGKSVLIRGAGDRGSKVLHYLRNKGVEVKGFLDNDCDKWGSKVEGVTVYPPDAFLAQEKDIVIILSIDYCEGLEDELRGKYSHVIGEKEVDEICYFPKNAGYKKFLPLGHYYSQYPDIDAIESKKNYFYDEKKPFLGIDFNEQIQLDTLRKMAEMYENVPNWKSEKEGYRAKYGNPAFPPGDMIGLCSMLQVLKPKRMIEVGSGWSSAVSLDTNEFLLHNMVELSFIEPYPQVLKSILKEQDKVHLRVEGLEAVELDYFQQLNVGDILFIDSTHVSKMGSDVNYLFFEILPRLKSGVYVHLHDIFYPFEYPWNWLSEKGRAWNELYLLRAFLQYNSDWEIVFFQNMMEKKYPEVFMEKWPVDMAIHGGSFWMRKIR